VWDCNVWIPASGEEPPHRPPARRYRIWPGPAWTARGSRRHAAHRHRAFHNHRPRVQVRAVSRVCRQPRRPGPGDTGHVGRWARGARRVRDRCRASAGARSWPLGRRPRPGAEPNARPRGPRCAAVSGDPISVHRDRASDTRSLGSSRSADAAWPGARGDGHSDSGAGTLSSDGQAPSDRLRHHADQHCRWRGEREGRSAG